MRERCHGELDVRTGWTVRQHAAATWKIFTTRTDLRARAWQLRLWKPGRSGSRSGKDTSPRDVDASVRSGPNLRRASRLDWHDIADDGRVGARRRSSAGVVGAHR